MNWYYWLALVFLLIPYAVLCLAILVTCWTECRYYYLRKWGGSEKFWNYKKWYQNLENIKRTDLNESLELVYERIKKTERKIATMVNDISTLQSHKNKLQDEEFKIKKHAESLRNAKWDKMADEFHKEENLDKYLEMSDEHKFDFSQRLYHEDYISLKNEVNKLRPKYPDKKKNKLRLEEEAHIDAETERLERKKLEVYESIVEYKETENVTTCVQAFNISKGNS